MGRVILDSLGGNGARSGVDFNERIFQQLVPYFFSNTLFMIFSIILASISIIPMLIFVCSQGHAHQEDQERKENDQKKNNNKKKQSKMKKKWRKEQSYAADRNRRNPDSMAGFYTGVNGGGCGGGGGCGFGGGGGGGGGGQ